MGAAGFNQITDLYDIYNIVQHTMIRYPKDAIIATLKEMLSRDSKYSFQADPWGYPFTPDLTDVDPDAGLYDDLTTRCFIGEQNRHDVIFYPAMIVKTGSFKYVPISLNRDQYRVEYESIEFVDGYGNRTFVNMPDRFVLSGAWEGSIQIEVMSRGIREVDDLAELTSMLFTDLDWNNLYRAGIAIKPTLQVGAISKTEDRNDKLFHRTVTIEIRTEWRRIIPINNIVNTIAFCVDFCSFADTSVVPNLEINTLIDNQED